MRSLARILIAGAAFFSSVASVAQTIVDRDAPSALQKSLKVGVGAEHDSNPLQAANNSDKDTRIFTTADVALAKDTEWLNVDLSYAGDYGDYVEDTLDEQYTLTGRGALIIGTASSPLIWKVSNTQQETLLDITEADVPSNASSRSTFSTGPELRLRFDERHKLTANYQFTHTNVEDSPIDSETESAALTWSTQVSKLFSWYLKAEGSEITPDLAQFAGYKQARGGIGFDYAGHAGAVSGAVYRSKINSETYPDDASTDFLLSFEKSWDVQNISASIERKVGNSSEGQGLESLLSLTDIGNQTFEPTKQETASLQYNIGRFFQHQSIGYQLSATKSTGLQSNNENLIIQNALRISRALSPLTQASINISHTNYETVDRDQLQFNRRTTTLSTGFNHSYSRSISFSCYAAHSQNRNDFSEYDVNLVSCSAVVQLL